ncbi:MAG: type II secretion system protein [Prosthecobacter sp.]
MSHPSSQHHPRLARFLKRGLGRAGFSLTELIVTISIIGTLASIVMVSMTGTFEAGRETIAIQRLEMLNESLHRRATAIKELNFQRRDDSTGDEFYVLRLLQYRNPNPNKVDINSPYFQSEYNPEPSSAETDYRFRWNGRRYELLRPGEAGSGLKMVFDASDITEPFQFPPNFNPGGA